MCVLLTKSNSAISSGSNNLSKVTFKCVCNLFHNGEKNKTQHNVGIHNNITAVLFSCCLLLMMMTSSCVKGQDPDDLLVPSLVDWPGEDVYVIDDVGLAFNESDGFIYAFNTTTMSPIMTSDGTPPAPYVVGVLDIEGNPSHEQVERILRRTEEDDILFTHESIEEYPPNVENYWKAVKSLQKKKVNTLIGPYSLTYAVATEHLRIPYFVTSQVPKVQPETPFLIQLLPNATLFASSVEDMLMYYDLTKIVVFFDSEGGEIILEKLAGLQRLAVTAVRVTDENLGRVRDELKLVREEYYTSFVSILDTRRTQHLLEQAVSLSMFSQPNKWLLVNMGLDEYDLNKYVDSHANMTVIRLMMDHSSKQCELSRTKISLKNAAFHDSVQLFMNLLDHWPKSKKQPVHMRKKVRKLKMDGCTGHLMFSKFGQRTESFLQLMTLDGYRAGQSGTWRSRPEKILKRVDLFKSYSSVSSYVTENVFGMGPLRVTTNMVSPFVQKKGPNSLEVNHPIYEGFCIDILVEMAKVLGIQYNITEVPDGKFGSKKSWGWTGMINELIHDRADMALAPFQMSISRAEVVDFSKPFMTKGTTVVVKRPEQEIWMFQFLSPFSKVVWFAIFVAFVCVSLILFAVSRVNSDRQAKSTSNLSESFWYIWGTLLRGSLSGSPKAISSRIVSSVWWFFCLILSSIYTANLAAFLTITVGDVGMNSAADLANQDLFDYGTVEGSQTETFFSHTQMNHYSKMWAHMSVLSVNSRSRTVDIGFERANRGKYAFIWDSPTIRHYISESCDLMEVGSPFDLKGYGFPYKKNAAFGEKLSWAILKLIDDGIIYRLENKWWRPQNCPDQKGGAKTKSLHLKTIAGMYVIIGAGAIMSILMCLLQYFLERYRNKKKQAQAREAESKNITTNLNLDERYGFDSGMSARDTITYANHSPLQYRSVNDWNN